MAVGRASHIPLHPTAMNLPSERTAHARRHALPTVYAVGLCGLASLLDAQRGVSQAQPILPVAVNKPTLTYVPALRASVLFGGYSARGVPQGETWLLRDGCWQHLEIAGPPPRGGHGAAYDAHRRRLVVFGGAGADRKPLGDTWEFDGTRWELRATSGPEPRMLLRMTYEEGRRRVLMFGGTSDIAGPHRADAWRWDGTSWQRAPTDGPPRFESALVYDIRRGAAVVFGGNRALGRRFAEGRLGDTWLLRGDEWAALRGSGPGARDHHGMAYHAARGVTLLFGGSSEKGMLDDTWILEDDRWTQLAGSRVPSARGGVPALTYDSDRRLLLMYGGWGEGGALQDLWEWDGQWTPVTASTCSAEAPRDRGDGT
jgi:hypothetical protein